MIDIDGLIARDEIDELQTRGVDITLGIQIPAERQHKKGATVGSKVVAFPGNK